MLLQHVVVGALGARVGAVGEARLAGLVAVEALVRSFGVDAELVGPVGGSMVKHPFKSKIYCIRLCEG